MQTIRIYQNGKLVRKITGIAYRVETQELRDQYPEAYFMWLR